MPEKISDVCVIIEEKKWIPLIDNLNNYVDDVVQKTWLKAKQEGAEIPSDGFAEIAVFLVNDDKIKKLNLKYRQIDKPTNVLSFPALENDIIVDKNMPFLAGDIIISLETTMNEAIENNQPLIEHFTHLLVHGCLHLAGYDHENKLQAEIMENLETVILAEMGIKNPYV